MSTSAAPPVPAPNSNGHPEWAAQLKVVQNNKSSTTTKIISRSRSDFSFESELGEGSYSTVMLARDIHTSSLYAIKVLDKRYIIKEKKVKYVNIEKDALNKLSKIGKKGIVHLFFTFQDEASLYFVLDYAPNGELLSLIKTYKSLNEKVTKYYAAQLISAIQFMHSQGIIHRDLKPENILLDSNHHIQITDFGTAKLLKQSSSSSSYIDNQDAKSFVGTAEYVSPELLTNSKSTGFPCDIWALGCIIYQLLAGKPPFKASNDYQTFQQIMKLKYAFTPGFPTVFRDFVKRILVPVPADRPTIERLKKHWVFRDINWQLEDEYVWYSPHPEFSAYKVTAKSIRKIPELGPDFTPRMVCTSASSSAVKKSRQASSNNNSSTLQSSSKAANTSLGVPLQSAAKSAAAALTTTSAKVAAIPPSSQKRHPSSSKKSKAASTSGTSLLAQIRKNSQVTISSSSNINTTSNKSPSGSVRHVSINASSSLNATNITSSKPHVEKIANSLESTRTTRNDTTYSESTSTGVVPQLAAFQHKYKNDTINASANKQKKIPVSAILLPRSLRRSSTSPANITPNSPTLPSSNSSSPTVMNVKYESMMATKEQNNNPQHNRSSSHSFFKSTKSFLFNSTGTNNNNDGSGGTRRTSDVDSLGAGIGIISPTSVSSLSTQKSKTTASGSGLLSPTLSYHDSSTNGVKLDKNKDNLISLAGTPVNEIHNNLKSPKLPKKISTSLMASANTVNRTKPPALPLKKIITATDSQQLQKETNGFSTSAMAANSNVYTVNTPPISPRTADAFDNFTNFDKFVREKNHKENVATSSAKSSASTKLTNNSNNTFVKKHVTSVQSSNYSRKQSHSNSRTHSRQPSSSSTSTPKDNKTNDNNKNSSSVSMSANTAALIAINKLQTGELFTQIPINSSSKRKSLEFGSGSNRRRSEDDRRGGRGDDLRMKYHDVETEERRGRVSAYNINNNNNNNKESNSKKESGSSSWVAKVSGIRRNVSG